MKKQDKVHSEPLVSFEQDAADPFGSWTGVPADPKEEPVQDADDL